VEQTLNDLLGECHRFPPNKEEDGVLHGLFTTTTKHDWCGEWVAVKESEPEGDARSILALGINAHAVTCLRNYGDDSIDTIGQLIARNSFELLDRRNLGHGTLDHIRECLKANGLYLRGEAPDK
jgi:DNA-directed RNA polymerase alpha subunit